MPPKKKTSAKKPAAKKFSVKKTAPRKAATKKKVPAKKAPRSPLPMMAGVMPVGSGGSAEKLDNLHRDFHVYCKDNGWSDANALFRDFKKGKIDQLLFHQKNYPNPGDQEIDIREFAGTDLHRWLTAGDPGHPCKTSLAEASEAIGEEAAQKDEPMQALLDVVAEHYE